MDKSPHNNKRPKRSASTRIKRAVAGLVLAATALFGFAASPSAAEKWDPKEKPPPTVYWWEICVIDDGDNKC